MFLSTLYLSISRSIDGGRAFSTLEIWSRVFSVPLPGWSQPAHGQLVVSDKWSVSSGVHCAGGSGRPIPSAQRSTSHNRRSVTLIRCRLVCIGRIRRRPKPVRQSCPDFRSINVAAIQHDSMIHAVYSFSYSVWRNSDQYTHYTGIRRLIILVNISLSDSNPANLHLIPTWCRIWAAVTLSMTPYNLQTRT